MIKDVHHVGIAVREMDIALAFYRDALELPLVKEGDAAARGARVALLHVNAGTCLELIQPTDDASPFAQHIATRGEGLHHLALWAKDVESLVASLREKAVPLGDPEPRAGFTGRLSYLDAAAFDGALLEVVQPEAGLIRQANNHASHITRIDHVVLRVPRVDMVCDRFQQWFGVPTKRTFERGETQFAFMRPGDVVIEVIGPREDGETGSGRIAGLAFEVKGIDELAAALKEKGYPVGEPHPALQGGRIVSVHQSGACGVPVAFIDFSDSPR